MLGVEKSSIRGSCFYATTYGESKINLRLTSEWCSQKRKPQNDGFISKMFNLPTFLLVLDDMVLSVRAKALSQLSVSLMRLYTQPSLICSPHCDFLVLLLPSLSTRDQTRLPAFYFENKLV